MTFGLPLDIERRPLMDEFLRLSEEGRAMPPRVVKDGPVFENVLKGNDVDVLKFPSPKWHPLDGGRYLDVMWAILTRSDPDRSLDIIHRAWSGPLDPAIPPEDKGFNSRLIIDATKPWEWKDRFPIAIGPDAETKRETRKKWGWILQQAVADAVREEATAPAD